MTFGRQLRHWRQRRGLSLAALAQASYVSKGYLSRVERDLRRPQRRIVELVDAALGADGELIAVWASEHKEPMLEGTAGGDTTKRRVFIKNAAFATALGFSGDQARVDSRAGHAARLRDALIPDSPANVGGREPILTSLGRSLSPVVISPPSGTRILRKTAYFDPCGSQRVRCGSDSCSTGLPLATRTLIKLSATPYAWTAAHLGEHAANASGDATAMLQARRDLVSLIHRVGDYRKARDLARATAETMRPHLATARPPAWGTYAALLSTGAVAAA